MRLSWLICAFALNLCGIRSIADANSSNLILSIANSVDTEAGLRYLDEVLQPKDCTGKEYAVVEFGGKAGFAAQFQLSAIEWLCTLSHHKYRVPVLLIGKLKGYSEGRECNHVSHDWTCFFKPISNCQDVLLKTGRKIESKSRHAVNQSIVPQVCITS
jgi:hypothetical protein